VWDLGTRERWPEVVFEVNRIGGAMVARCVWRRGNGSVCDGVKFFNFNPLIFINLKLTLYFIFMSEFNR
jgi:hypothetical protein